MRTFYAWLMLYSFYPVGPPQLAQICRVVKEHGLLFYRLLF